MQDLENSMYNTSKTLRGMFRCFVHRIQNNIENITSNSANLTRLKKFRNKNLYKHTKETFEEFENVIQN